MAHVDLQSPVAGRIEEILELEFVAAAIGGFAAAGAWRDEVAWWALLVAVVLTGISGLDYARVAPRLWRGGAAA